MRSIGYLLLLAALLAGNLSKAGHYIHSARFEYHFIHQDSLELILILKPGCTAFGNQLTGPEMRFYSQQRLHIARQSDTLIDSLPLCNAYLNNSVCPDSMSRCLGKPIQFSSAIFIYRKVFPLSYFGTCEMTFFWQDETNDFSYNGRSSILSTGHAYTPAYIYAYLNRCQVDEPNSPVVSREFPDVFPRNTAIDYNYGIQTDEPEDDSIYVDFILPKVRFGVDSPYNGLFDATRPFVFVGFPSPSGLQIDHECANLHFTLPSTQSISQLSLRIQRFVRRNDSTIKVSELNYEHVIWVVHNQDYQYYFPTPPVYEQQWCIDKREYIPIDCGSGLPREPGPQKICTRDSVLLETPLAADYTYSWYRNGDSIAGAHSNTYWASDSGTYRVAVENSQTGCFKYSINMTVVIDDGTIPQITYDSLRPYCQPDTALLYRDSLDYSWYQWRRNDRPYSSDSALVLPVTDAGTYSLDVVNERGCRVRSNELDLAIHTPQNPELFQPGEKHFCGSFSDTLRALIPLDAYVWEGPGNGTDSLLIADSAGWYFLAGKDTLGCAVLDSLLLVRHEYPESGLQEDSGYCAYDTVYRLLTAQLHSSDSIRYSWNASPTDTFPDFAVHDTGWVFLRMEGPAGCITLDSVWQYHHPEYDPGIGTDRGVCPEDSVQVLLESPLSTVPRLRYLWNTGDTLHGITVRDTGLYWLRVSDSAHCTYTDSLRVYRFTGPEVVLGSDTVFCGQDTLSLLLSPQNLYAGYHYRWNTLGMDTLPEYLATGTGWYLLQVLDSNSCLAKDSLHIGKMPLLEPDLGMDTLICDRQLYILYTPDEHKRLWTDGSTDTFFTVTVSGDYWLELSDSLGCSQRDSVRVDFMQSPEVELIDSILCEAEWIELEVSGQYPEYLWSTGSRTNYTRVRDTGLVWVRVTNACASAFDSCWIRGCRYEPLEIYIPNSFTPNKDGLNPVFTIHIDHYREFDIAIYDRWGEQIHHSSDPTNIWDGLYQGEPVQEDVYVYVIRVLSEDGRLYAYYGNITVLR